MELKHYVVAVIVGALTGWAGAARADVMAFKSWKRYQDIRDYDWAVATFRWLQGAVSGAMAAVPADALIRALTGLVSVLVLAVTLAGCASVPLKQQISRSHQVAHQALVAVDEAERALCAPIPATPNVCGSAVAAALGLTDAKHQAISRTLARAFDHDAKAGVAVIAWRAGDPVPADLRTLLQDAQDVVAVATTITDNALVTRAQALVARVAAVVALFGGGL